MFFKIALRNVRRSARDYAIYFITLALSVAIFYAFNSISSQAVLIDAESADIQRAVDMLKLFMGVFSVVVACVLAFLVLYANRFLIRRRKREFGTYLLLGMSPGRVSRILLYETLTVGVGSLVLGLMVGLLVSQGLSFVTASLMSITMRGYHFVISWNGILLTIACFVLIFALAALIDCIYIKRCKLANLLAAQDANEKSIKAHLPLRVCVFVISLACCGIAYWQLHLNGFQGSDIHFWIATGGMLLGTFLFFWSVAGFVLAIIQKSPTLYLKGLSLFTVRQISAKINTTFAALSVVSVLLFFGITVMAGGFGFASMFVANLEESTQFDATILANMDDGVGTIDKEPQQLQQKHPEVYQRVLSYEGDMNRCFEEAAPQWSQLVAASSQLDYYNSHLSFGEAFDQAGFELSTGDRRTDEQIAQFNIRVLALSQFNANNALLGKKALSLESDEYLINNGMEYYDSMAKDMASSDFSLTIAGIALHGSGSFQRDAVRTSVVVDTALEVVVPDEVVQRLKEQDLIPDYSYLNIMYSCPRTQGDALLTECLSEAFPPSPDNVIEGRPSISDSFQANPWPVKMVTTAQEMIDQASGFRMSITYLALYIGFVLLMATATILAIQQLSETTDSLPRYRRLETLGCERKAIVKSLRTQTAVYFLAPLVLAVCHAVCALRELSRVILGELGTNISGSILVAAAVVAIIYLSYYLITYWVSKSILRDRR